MSEVLLGERLGRRHQRALAARLDGAEQRVQRHDRLPRADVALEQALHRPLVAEVGVELRDRPLLVAREPERQRRPVALDQRAGSAQRPRAQLFAPPTAAEQADLEREQLVERQAAAAELSLGRRARTVQGPERVCEQREPPPRLHVRRDRIGPVAGTRQHGRDHLAKLLDRDLLARRVDGREIRGLGHPVQVVRLDGELAAPELAAQADMGSRLQLLRQPRLVEPDGRDLTAPVVHPGLHEREPSPRTLHRRAAHGARDRHLLAREQAGDRSVRHGRLVPVRPVSQRVVHGPQPEAREAAGERRADAGERGQRQRQQVRPRTPTRRRPGLRGPDIREARVGALPPLPADGRMQADGHDVGACEDAAVSESKAVAERVEEVAPGVWWWSVHDERINFVGAGYAVSSDEGTVLIDPHSLSDEALGTLGEIEAICLTTSSHQRCSWRLRRELGVQVRAPAASQEVDEEPDVRYSEGDRLPGGLRARLHARRRDDTAHPAARTGRRHRLRPRPVRPAPGRRAQADPGAVRARPRRGQAKRREAARAAVRRAVLGTRRPDHGGREGEDARRPRRLGDDAAGRRDRRRPRQPRRARGCPTGRRRGAGRPHRLLRRSRQRPVPGGDARAAADRRRRVVRPRQRRSRGRRCVRRRQPL